LQAAAAVLQAAAELAAWLIIHLKRFHQLHLASLLAVAVPVTPME
jgi:hypothetical protein